uniref:zinc-alpha-2-glycoprotein-like n=1 Tax=Ictidomys tridecemlineatus TaxID=43179 RepID=UPI001A9D7E59|nr:zinc-alpha-2-glycoprotein-like [Ictidomys tridecemlineatus]
MTWLPLLLLFSFLGSSQSYACLEDPEESSSLHILYTTIAPLVKYNTETKALAYVNNQLFLKFDSRNQSIQHWGLWETLESSMEWRELVQNVKLFGRESLVLLWDMKQRSQQPGPHILQMALGCDLKENGNFKSFWKYSYEGQDYLTFQPATLCWKADAPEAQSMAQSLRKDRDLARHHGAFINGDCQHYLQKYPGPGKKALVPSESPSVSVTSRQSSSWETVLQCQDLCFFPCANVLSLWRGQEALPLVHSGCRLNGNGTCQCWVNVTVPRGEEAMYSCHAEHGGLKEPLIIKWDFSSDSTRPQPSAWVFILAGVWTILGIAGLWEKLI